MSKGDFDFLKNSKLTVPEREAADRVGQILGQEFLNNAKLNKGLLGVNPTDNDAKLLAAPMANINDTARSVQYWARQQMLQNYYRQDLYKELMDHDKKVGRSADPASFFYNPAYENAVDTYVKRKNDLRKIIGPTSQAQ